MQNLFLPIISVVGVSALSILGVLFFLINDRIIKRVLLYLVSFSTGALLGDVFIHIIPELAEEGDGFAGSMLVVLLGVLFSFVVEKVIHWRHCHHLPHGNDCNDHTHDHSHEHVHAFGVMSLIGEAAHNLIDGVIIAAAYIAGPAIGISTTIAVIFHEVPHEIGNFAVLLHSGMTRKRALFLNLISGLMGIVGALLVIFLNQAAVPLTAYMLPFAAGNLLYIAGSDLIPELHKQTRVSKSILQFIFMLAGMAVMYALLSLE